MQEQPFDYLCPITMSHYPASYSYTDNDLGVDELKGIKDNLSKKRDKNSTDSMIYIHIPFCDSFCTFCRYARQKTPERDTMKTYFDAMKDEIERYISLPYIQDMVFDLIYFGGGTPSVIPIDILDDFFKFLKEKLPNGNNLSVSFEGEARSLKNKELLAMLVSHGLQRISMGVQTFDLKLRKLLGRRETIDDIQETCENAKGMNVEVNLDFLHWLPDQNLEHIENDIDMVNKFSPTDVDWYIMTYDPLLKNDPLSRMVSKDKKRLAKLETLLNMRRLMKEKFNSLGYQQHFVDNFASVDSKDSYHVIRTGSYDGESEILGIGVSALGTIGGYVYSNPESFEEYFHGLQEKRLSYRWLLELNSERTLQRALFHFPRNLHLPKKVFNKVGEAVAEKYLNKLNNMIALNLIVDSGDEYQITEEGKLWYSNIACEFTMDEDRIRMLRVLYKKLQN